MKKSVRDMNYLERLHYSLSAKMFHTILMFSTVLALVALLFSLGFYSNSLRAQYSEKASVLADNIVLAIDPDLIGRIVKEAESIYDDLDESVRNDHDSPVYYKAFDGLKDFRYSKILDILIAKAKAGVDVRVMYDGMCEISTLPSNYTDLLQKQVDTARKNAEAIDRLSTRADQDQKGLARQRVEEIKKQ